LTKIPFLRGISKDAKTIKLRYLVLVLNSTIELMSLYKFHNRSKEFWVPKNNIFCNLKVYFVFLQNLKFFRPIKSRKMSPTLNWSFLVRPCSYLQYLICIQNLRVFFFTNVVYLSDFLSSKY
jgi:hypothetical protein